MSDQIPIWLSVAKAFVGLREVAGSESNPVILRWARDIQAPAWYATDEQAWCAVFLNRILLACQMPLSGDGYDVLRAKSFETWGERMEAPALGAILTFVRTGGGHVGFYVGERKDAYRVLGGNQSNAVSEAWIDKTRLTSVRWPPGRTVPEPRPVQILDTSGSTEGRFW